MSTKYRIDTVETMLHDVSSVLDGDREHDRFALADTVEMICAAESFFPRKPFSITRKAAKTLRQKVASGCSLCVHPDAMAAHVESIKSVLYAYRTNLVTWLKNEDVQFDDNGNIVVVPVSELRPTIERK